MLIEDVKKTIYGVGNTPPPEITDKTAQTYRYTQNLAGYNKKLLDVDNYKITQGKRITITQDDIEELFKYIEKDPVSGEPIRVGYTKYELLRYVQKTFGLTYMTYLPAAIFRSRYSLFYYKQTTNFEYTFYIYDFNDRKIIKDTQDMIDKRKKLNDEAANKKLVELTIMPTIIQRIPGVFISDDFIRTDALCEFTRDALVYYINNVIFKDLGCSIQPNDLQYNSKSLFYYLYKKDITLHLTKGEHNEN